jgi:hypothetical protein
MEVLDRQSQARCRLEPFLKLAVAVNGQLHIKDEPPLILH